MAGPWEKYGKPEAAAGPWTKFQVKPDGPSAEQTALESYGNAATLGYLPQLQAAVQKLFPDASGGADAELEAQGFNVDQESYLESRDRNIGRMDRQAEENPNAAMLGTGAGILATAAIPVGHAARGASLAAKAGRGAATGAAFGAAANPGDVEGELSPVQAGQRGKNAAVGAAFGAAVPLAGAALSGGAKLAGKGAEATGRGVAKVSKKVFSGLFGVPVEAIDDYLARHPELKDIVDVKSGITSLQDDIERVTTPMGDKLRGSKAALADAKAANAAKRFDLSGEIPVARQALKEAEARAVAETAPGVTASVKRLRDEISKGSGRSFEILDEAGAVVSTPRLKSDLTRVIKSMESEAVTDKQTELVALLTRYRERLDKLGKDIPASQAKKLVQALDDEIAFSMGGSVSGGKDKMLLGVRRRIDQDLKAVPEYRTQMAKVARDVRLSKKLKGFEQEQGAINRLRGIDSLGRKAERDTLLALEERFGTEFIQKVQRQNLPEYSKLKGIMEKMRAAKKGEGVKLMQAQLDEAAEAMGAFKSLVPDEFGKSGVQSAIRSQLVPTQNVNTGRAIEALDDAAGTKFGDRLKDLKTLKAFDSEYTRGSANTNLWGMLGGLVGSAIGGGAGTVGGAAGGAAVGRLLIDKYGPATARTILDGVAKLKTGMPPGRWVQGLNIPTPVKQALLKEHLYYQVALKAEAGGLSPKRLAKDESTQDRKPSGGPDRWAQTGLERLGISGPEAQKLLKSKEGKRLLIEASDLKPGSPRLKKIKEQIQRGTK